MPRTTLTPVRAPGGNIASGTLVPYAAGDVANGNDVPFTGKELVLVRNVGAGSHTVTFTSSADQSGRLGNITGDAIAAGVSRVYGPFPHEGWIQAGGKLFIDVNHLELEIAVITLP